MNLILIGKNFNVEVSMEISDKELLAICNLSNLRMEFANLNKNKAERSEDEKDFRVRTGDYDGNMECGK